ncbi:energy transducer TonB [Pseudoalteromonas maricaloris]|uniref:energy transducer TonB n=1 Tax=Pseudoalteromonas maricaloris TaxID=184924 RepID=UPI003C19610C
MKYSIVVSLAIVLLMGCASKPLPDRANAALQETANPTYPAYAARNRIEGYVQMSFDISESGKPINIQVLKSVPEQVFDKAAIKALSNWKYAPKVENGVAVIQKDLKVQLDFTLG